MNQDLPNLYDNVVLADLGQLDALELQMAATDEPDDIARIAIEGALALTQSDGSAFLRYDAQAGQLLQVGSVGCLVAHDGATFCADDLPRGGAQGSMPASPDALAPSWPGAAWTHAAVPVAWRDEQLGILAVVRQQEDAAYQPGAVRMLQRLAHRLAVALYTARLERARDEERERLMAENARLTQRLREQLHDAEVLNRVLQAATTVLAPVEILQNICTEVKRALDVPLVTARLLQDDDLQWVAEARDADYPRAPNTVLAITEIPLLHRALMMNIATRWADVRAEAPELVGPVFTAAGRSGIVAPLLVRDAVVGMLQVEQAMTGGFSDAQATLLQLVVTAVTPTLENGWLFEQMQAVRAETEEAYAELRRLDLLKSQFIQNVSHEFRTPLAIVKGYVDLIVQGDLGNHLDPAMAQALRAVHTHTDNLVRIVESITTLEEAEVGHLYMTPQPIQPVCRAALKANWQKALRRNVEIMADIPDHLPLPRIDGEAMLRALNHILDNAVKFSYEGGQVRLSTSADDDFLWIRVEDDGIGIPEEELTRIFDRFYQVNGTTTRRYGGIGLGLSLAQEIVVYHKGEIWAESPGEGRGTTMTIRLPLIAVGEDSRAA